jgi:hypothetical protein
MKNNTGLWIIGILALLTVTIYASVTPEMQKPAGYIARNIFPSLDSSGKLVGYDTGTVFIYASGKKRLYALSSRLVSPRGISTTSVATHYRYVVFHIDSSWGYNYDSLRVPVKRKSPLDSLFMMEWIKQNNFYSALKNSIADLLFSKKDERAGILTEKYLLKDKTTLAEAGTLAVVYRPAAPQHPDITLSRELDSLRGMSASRIEFRTFPKYFKEQRFTMPGYTIINELNKSDRPPPAQMLRLLNEH